MRSQTEFPVQRLGSSPLESVCHVVRLFMPERDVDLLRFIIEQSAVRMDHLARYLGLSMSATRHAVARLVDRDLMRTFEVVPGTPRWAVATGPGVYVVSPKLGKRQFGDRPPTPRFARHFMIINELRLRFAEEYSGSRWISERMLIVNDWSKPRPDGVLVAGGRREAIEVQLSNRTTDELADHVAGLFKRFDVVRYFCAPEPRRALERVQARENYPRLIIEDV